MTPVPRQRPKARQQTAEQVEALAGLRAAYATYRATDDRLNTARIKRDACVRGALAAGVTQQAVADLIGTRQPNIVRDFGQVPAALDRSPLARESAMADLRSAQGAYQDVLDARTHLDLDIDAAVAACRTERVTWDAVAEVLGMIQEDAIRKYGPRLRTTVVATTREATSPPTEPPTPGQPRKRRPPRTEPRPATS